MHSQIVLVRSIVFQRESGLLPVTLDFDTQIINVLYRNSYRLFSDRRGLFDVIRIICSFRGRKLISMKYNKNREYCSFKTEQKSSKYLKFNTSKIEVL